MGEISRVWTYDPVCTGVSRRGFCREDTCFLGSTRAFWGVHVVVDVAPAGVDVVFDPLHLLSEVYTWF